MADTAEKSSLLLPERMNERAPAQLPATQASPMAMLQIAVQRGDDIEKIKQLMALAKDMQAMQARQAFDAAMSAAKSDIKPIVKNRTVDFTSQKGRTNYQYEDMAGVAEQIDPILARNGLSYRYRSKQESKTLTITCIIAHAAGHSEETELSAAYDESGNKNAIQSVGSTATFLQRYTLKLALGLSATKDDDGRASSDTASAFLSDEQLATVESLIDDIKPDVPALLKYAGVEALADIPASSYNMVVQAIRAAGKHKTKAPA